MAHASRSAGRNPARSSRIGSSAIPHRPRADSTPLPPPRSAPCRLALRTCLTVAAVLVGPVLLEAQPQRVYIAPDDHTDYFWSADEDTYRQAFLNTLDYYLDLADATSNNLPAYQSRWNCDGSLWLWTYEQQRTPQQFQRLIDRIADGHVSVPLNALCVCLGASPTEAVIRGMYYPGHIERRHNLRFRLAYMIENQTQPYGLTALWAGSGARYSWKGICGCDSQVPDAWDREHDIYRAAGPDGSTLLMKWNSMLAGNQGLGGYAEARYPATAVDFVTVNAPYNGFALRYPYDVIGCFGKGWDDVQTMTAEFVSTALTKTDATRQVIVSNEEDFFQDFTATYDVAALPAQACSFGNEWELYCAGLAEVTARAKRAVEKLRAAEALAAIVTLFDPDFMAPRQAARDLAWMNLGLFWEHDFGMVGPPTGSTGIAQRIAWQRRITAELESYVDTLHDDAAAALANLVPTEGAYQRFYVFNPVGWLRTAAADLPWPSPDPVHVVTAAGQIEVPSQLVTLDGTQYLRILAADLPPVGYRVYEIRPGTGQDFGPAATVTDGGGGSDPLTVTYTMESNDRDATSVRVGPPGSTHEVRTFGYSSTDRRDYVSADSEEESAAVEFALDLPPGATVHEARLVVQAGPYSNPSPTGGMRVQSYAVDDAAPFADGPFGDLLNHLPVSPEYVLWPSPTWTSGADQTSPNLQTLVQAFIDRPGYAPGRHLGLVITEGSIEANRYYGWEDLAAGTVPPRLIVTYDPPAALRAGELIVENSVYRLRVVERGALTSLIDKTRDDREFVQLLGGQAVHDLGPSTGTLSVENAGAVSVTVQAAAPAPLAHVTRVTVYRDGRRVDIANQINQNFSSPATAAFSFALSDPDVHHEEVGAIMRARLLADGGQYSPRNARYDWLTLNHFADLTGSAGVGVTLSNRDCCFFRLGNSATASLDTLTPQITALLGGNVANGGNGLPAQGGDTLFHQHYALQTHDAYDPAAAMRMALEHQNPPVCRLIAGANPRLPAAEFSAVSSSDPDVLLWAFKPAEDGADQGVVARLWNVSSNPRTTTLQLAPYRVGQARRVTHLETDEGPEELSPGGEVTPSFAPQQLRTFRLVPARCGDVDADGSIDEADFAYWEECATGPATGPVPAGCGALDCDGDGHIDLADFARFQWAWNPQAPLGRPAGGITP